MARKMSELWMIVFHGEFYETVDANRIVYDSKEEAEAAIIKRGEAAYSLGDVIAEYGRAMGRLYSSD